MRLPFALALVLYVALGASEDDPGAGEHDPGRTGFARNNDTVVESRFTTPCARGLATSQSVFTAS